jgi:hypothetical protein
VEYKPISSEQQSQLDEAHFKKAGIGRDVIGDLAKEHPLAVPFLAGGVLPALTYLGYQAFDVGKQKLDPVVRKGIEEILPEKWEQEFQMQGGQFGALKVPGTITRNPREEAFMMYNIGAELAKLYGATKLAHWGDKLIKSPETLYRIKKVLGVPQETGLVKYSVKRDLGSTSEQYFQKVESLASDAKVLPTKIMPKELKGEYLTWARKVRQAPETRTAKFAENINLETMPEDVRPYIADIIEIRPSVGKTPTITNAELIERARELKGTPTINYLTKLPEGTLEAETLKLRQGNTELIRNALGAELGDLKAGIDFVIETDLEKQRKVASIFGRGLQQQKISPDVQQDMAFQIKERLAQIKKDPVFKNDEGLIQSIEKLKDTVISKDFNPTNWNKVYYVWLNSILSNPFTHLTNVASNAVFAVAKVPEKIASAVWDLPLSLFTGKRTHYFGEATEMVKGALSKEPAPAIEGSKLDTYSKPIGGTAGKIIGTPTNLLKVEDDFSKSLVGKMEMYAQRYAGKSGEELSKLVSEEQLYRTFQNEPARLARGILNLRKSVPGVRWIIPFVKTPANIMATSLERTPLKIVDIIYKGATKKADYSQEELARDLGLFSMGTMLSAWIATQFVKGNVTGGVPSKADERDAFFRTGKKPNAVKVGNYWVPLERLEPIGTAFAIIGNLIQDYKESDKDIPSEKALDAVAGLARSLSSKGYLSGMTSFIKATTAPEMYGAGWIRRIISGAVPNVLSFLAQLKDPYFRQADSVLEYMKAKTPFASETLEPKLDLLGQPAKRDFMNIGRAKDSPVEQMLSDTPISSTTKKIGKDKMTAKEYNKVLKDSGDILRPILEQLAMNPEFLQLPQEIRQKTIDNIVRDARSIPRAEITRKKMEESPVGVQTAFHKFVAKNVADNYKIDEKIDDLIGKRKLKEAVQILVDKKQVSSSVNSLNRAKKYSSRILREYERLDTKQKTKFLDSLSPEEKQEMFKLIVLGNKTREFGSSRFLKQYGD